MSAAEVIFYVSLGSSIIYAVIAILVILALIKYLWN